MIALLLLLSWALAQDGKPDDEIGEVPVVVEQVEASLAEEVPTATIRYFDEADYPDDGRFPWVILMNALIGLGMAAGGAYRMVRGAPASSVARISDPRVASIVTGIDALTAGLGQLQEKPAQSSSLVVVDAVLLESLDAMITEQARSNELMAIALERMPDLLEES